jgi:glycerate kinase
VKMRRKQTVKIVTAIDSFKGSMTSMEAGLAVTEGIHRVDSDVDVQIRPLADGGEGTVDALVAGMNGMKHIDSIRCRDPQSSQNSLSLFFNIRLYSCIKIC